MNKAFTLVELLVVVGIMGLLGTISVGGYRAMQRGMEERGVMENVNALVKAAYERAQIDRQPTMLYFWNETLRSESDEENETVIGHAVAVRRYGRVSGIAGELVLDEFADLEKVYPPDATSGATDQENTMSLYNLDNLQSGASRKYSIVSSQAEKHEFGAEIFPHGRPQNDEVGNGTMEVYGFRLVDANNVQWKVGSAYGFEFAEITLPKNYIFGSAYSKTVDSPIEEAGAMVFKVGVNSGSGVTGGSTVQGSVTVYSLRPNESGMLTAKKVASNDNPY